MQIYVDMDGVLADFDKHYLKTFGKVPMRPGGVDWKAVREHKGFYQSIPQMPDLDMLWDRLYPYKPIVLTGIPSSVAEAEAEDNKREWCKRHLTPDTEIITCRAKDKHTFCQPGDLLIDDYEKHRQLWIDAGGLWITHINARATCAWLTELGII
jgi:hypothetical protein